MASNLIIGIYGPDKQANKLAAEHLRDFPKKIPVISFLSVDHCLFPGWGIQEGDVLLVENVDSEEEIETIHEKKGVIFFICSDKNISLDGYNPLSLSTSVDYIIRNDDGKKEFGLLLQRRFYEALEDWKD